MCFLFLRFKGCFYEENEDVLLKFSLRQSLPCVRGGAPQGRRGCQSLSLFLRLRKEKSSSLYTREPFTSVRHWLQDIVSAIAGDRKYKESIYFHPGSIPPSFQSFFYLLAKVERCGRSMFHYRLLLFFLSECSRC